MIKFRAKALGSGHTIESYSMLTITDGYVYLGRAKSTDSYHNTDDNGNIGIKKIESNTDDLLFVRVDPRTLIVSFEDNSGYEMELDGLGVEYAD